MKIHISKLYGIFVTLFLVSGLACAAPEIDPAIKLRDTPAPKALKATLPAKTRVIRSAVAPVGPRGASCWVLFVATGLMSENEPDNLRLSVLLPTGRKKWRKLYNDSLGSMYGGQAMEAQLNWLDARHKSGFVLVVPNGESTRAMAFPQGWSTRQRVEQSFTGAASSISATYYSFDSVGNNGYFAVREIQSEPGMDEEGNTINVSRSTKLNWNGTGWE